MLLDRLPVSLGMAVVGWWLGWASAWLTQRLQAGQNEPENLPNYGPLVRDPICQAGCAALWAAAPLVLAGEWWRWVEAGLLGVPLIQVAVTDLRTRYVYRVIAVIGLGFGLAFGWQFHATAWWTSLAGAVGGGVALGGVYLIGRFAYRSSGIEPMARGDIEIAAMVGAVAGACTAQALFLGVILGGVFAVATWAASRSRHGFMPYGPGLCLGGLATLFWC